MAKLRGVCACLIMLGGLTACATVTTERQLYESSIASREEAEAIYKSAYESRQAGRLTPQEFQRVKRAYEAWREAQQTHVKSAQTLSQRLTHVKDVAAEVGVTP